MNKYSLEVKEDKIVDNIVKQFKQRSALGQTKYGCTLSENNLSELEWIEHAKQEAMDFVLYLETLKEKLTIKNK